jgi:hypothetical protein
MMRSMSTTRPADTIVLIHGPGFDRDIAAAGA